MKKHFETPELKIVELNVADIIATSGAGGTVPDAPFKSRSTNWSLDEDDEY